MFNLFQFSISLLFLGRPEQNLIIWCFWILGEAVGVEDEVVVVNSIVLPNKTLNVSVQEEIIL